MEIFLVVLCVQNSEKIVDTVSWPPSTQFPDPLLNLQGKMFYLNTSYLFIFRLEPLII